MRKTTLLGAMLTAFSFTSLAGGLLTNTNQHIAFNRNFAREATRQIDGVISNPAGVAFMEEGFYLSLNNQSAFQTRTIQSTFAPFAGNVDNLGNATKTFKGETSVPIIPSAFAVYKRGNWAFSAYFAITGGGGKATFNDGLGSFESQVAMVPGLLTSKGFKTNKYSVDEFMDGKQFIYGLQVGASYKINENLSAFGGFRTNIVSNSYIGHIRDIQANIGNATDYGTSMINVSSYFKSLSDGANAAALASDAAGLTAQADAYRAKAKLAGSVSDMTKDKELDCDQTGWGITPIIGLHYSQGRLNVGMKYEFMTSLNIENDTKRDDTGLFKDGVNTPNDIPSMLTFGAEYAILPSLRASAGYHHFFDSKAEMANNKQKYTGNGTNEYLGGLEYDVNNWLTVSCGGQITDYDVKDGYQSDMSFSLSSYSLGGGFAVMLNERTRVNVAYFQTFYDKYTEKSAVYNGNAAGLPGTDVYARTNKVFGVGVDYKF